MYSYRDDAWTEAGKLQARMYGMRAATVNNRVLLFGNKENFMTYKRKYFFYSGGSDNDHNARNDILEYDPETKEWTHIGTMREARAGHAVSVVDFRDYVDSC